MRTDSVALSDDALAELRDLIGREYGKGALPDGVQVYKSKSKNAQEAHEAVRPTSAMRTPRSVASFLNDDQRKLYELIWKRTVACQMVHATLNTVAVEFPVGRFRLPRHGYRPSSIPASSAVYEEGRDQKGEDDDEQRRLPRLKQGDVVPVSADRRRPAFHRAAAARIPKRAWSRRWRNTASVVRRPTPASSRCCSAASTSCSDSRRFKPTDVGRAVSQFLSGHFAQYVDYDFTARLEDELDAVSRGEEAWVPLLERFWLPFKTLVDDKTESVDRSEATGARELGDGSENGQAGVGAPGPLWRLRADRQQGRRSQADLREPAARAEHAHHHPRRGDGVVQAAAHPGQVRRGRRCHRRHRSLRAVREAGQHLCLAEARGRPVRHRVAACAAAGAGEAGGHRQPDDPRLRQRRAGAEWSLRSVHHRRREERTHSQGSRAEDAHRDGMRRTAGRCPGEEASWRSRSQEDRGEEGHRQEGGGEESSAPRTRRPRKPREKDGHEEGGHQENRKEEDGGEEGHRKEDHSQDDGHEECRRRKRRRARRPSPVAD